MRDKKKILLAIGISFALHGIFLTLSSGIRIKGIYEDEVVRFKSKRAFKLKTLTSEVPKKKPVRTYKIPYAEVVKETLKFEGPVDSPYGKAQTERTDQIAKKASPTIETRQIEQPAEVTRIERASQIKKDKKAFKELKEGTYRETQKKLVSAEDIKTENKLADIKDVFGEGGVDTEFIDKMPGITPQLAHRPGDTAGQDSRDLARAGRHVAVIKRTADMKDLKEYLVSELLTYQDPNDGQKYFQITIWLGKDADDLKTVPKEIVFVVDCSSSTQQERLDEFKDGIIAALNNLNTEDMFNVIAFKKGIAKFRPNSVKPEPQNIKRAARFLDELTSGQRTDAYSALYESINTKVNLTPSYLVFLSDGHPTQGVTDSRKLITEISQLNNNAISVFAFSGGVNVNRYLLDFISFKNRGWTEYSYRTHLIGENLANMYVKIKDPILFDVRYHLSGLDEETAFPKTLPDFFRNTEFTLVGKYTDEEKFVLQLLGDVTEETNEFILEGSLKDAAMGDKNIARNWGLNKIYYLIGSMAHDKDNTAIVKEIEALSEKFEIRTPYIDVLRASAVPE